MSDNSEKGLMCGYEIGRESGLKDSDALFDSCVNANLKITSRLAYRSNNLVTGRQLRAARTLAGMTQRDLAAALGINERAVCFWERKHDRRPTSAPNDTRIEQALLAHGVILFAEPTPGARLAEKR